MYQFPRQKESLPFLTFVLKSVIRIYKAIFDNFVMKLINKINKISVDKDKHSTHTLGLLLNSYFTFLKPKHSSKCHELFILSHPDYCRNPDFHPALSDNCICVNCGDLASAYHQYFCMDKQ